MPADGHSRAVEDAVYAAGTVFSPNSEIPFCGTAEFAYFEAVSCEAEAPVFLREATLRSDLVVFL